MQSAATLTILDQCKTADNQISNDNESEKENLPSKTYSFCKNSIFNEPKSSITTNPENQPSVKNTNTIS